MERVEEGVSNFRLFQTDMREFVTEFRTNERNRDRVDKRRSRIHFWLLGILSGVIVAGFGILLTWALDFEHKHKISEDNKPTVSQQHQPQSAGLPPSVAEENRR